MVVDGSRWFDVLNLKIDFLLKRGTINRINDSKSSTHLHNKHILN